MAVLAGQPICPQHRIPCWVCTALSFLAQTVRAATYGGRVYIKSSWEPDVWYDMSLSWECQHYFWPVRRE